jgi:DNA-binding NarL/FixJ family response regulator
MSSYSNKKTINVAIVDDKQANRVSLSEKLEEHKDISVILMAKNGEDFLNKMKDVKELPDVVLMDIDMPVMNGIEAVNIASELYPSTNFLMLTVFDDDEKIFEAIKCGAIGYLLKDDTIESIIESIIQIIEFGGSPMSPRIARKALQLLMNSKVEKVEKEKTILSDREMDILNCLVSGMNFKAIADKLFISPNTVRTHITNIYKKMHVQSKTQAVMLAVKNKWF